MNAALIAGLFFTVVTLVITGYFILGSIPLLVLKHDTPLDGKFVRGFFNTYYLLALPVTVATALSYAVAGRYVLSAGAAVLALLAIVLRRQIIAGMDALRAQIETSGSQAITRFRQLHVAAIALNIAQLAVMVWGLIALSMQMRG